MHSGPLARSKDKGTNGIFRGHVVSRIVASKVDQNAQTKEKYVFMPVVVQRKHAFRHNTAYSSTFHAIPD
jgi:hypothetical protein